MKKFTSIILALFITAAFAFGVTYSYKDNVYQKLAEEYAVKADRALDAGDYDLAVEYSEKAEENAALSEEFIRNMRKRAEAEALLAKAEERLEYARKIGADENYPVAYNAASDYYDEAYEAFEGEDYENASYLAQKVLDTLADIKGMYGLPKFYIVQPWEVTRDCLWNISGRSYVYNNPWLWENLYQANRESLPDPDNPNLILPGMKLEIPSITGEFRSGTYDPNQTYDTYSPN